MKTLILSALLPLVLSTAAIADPLDDFADTFLRVCLTDDPSAFGTADAASKIPHHKGTETVAGVVHTAFGTTKVDRSKGNWMISNYVGDAKQLFGCNFRVMVDPRDVALRLRSLPVSSHLPPFIDWQNSDQSFLMIEGDGRSNPAFIGVVTLLPLVNSETKEAIGTIGTMSHMPVWPFMF